MHQGLLRFSQVVSLDYDPAADDVIPIWRAPKACVLRGAYATVVNDVAASTANYFAAQLKNVGAAGAGTTLLGSIAGGTAGWTSLVPKTLLAETDTAVNVAEGDVIALNYNEEGTGTFVLLSVQLDVTF